jgi:hypothetical protein
VDFSDELRLGLIGQTRRVWAPVGVKVVQPLQYERQWCYVLLVVDGRAGRLWWSWTLGMTADHLQPEVAKWHGAGIDAGVWDRAPAHQTLSGQPQDVVLILQPPHSPKLNPAERVIEAMKGLSTPRCRRSTPPSVPSWRNSTPTPPVSAPSPAGTGFRTPSTDSPRPSSTILRRSHAGLVLLPLRQAKALPEAMEAGR